MAAQVVGLAGNQMEDRSDLNPPPSQRDLMPEISTGRRDVILELKHHASRRPVFKNQILSSNTRIITSYQFLWSVSEVLKGTGDR